MGHLSDDALRDVIEGIYEAGLRPELWRPLLNRLTDVLGSDNAGIFAFPDPAAICSIWSDGNDEVVDWFLREGWHLNNPRPARALRVLGMMRVGTDADLFTPWELKHLPFNAEIHHRMGYCDAGAVIGEVDGNAMLFSTQRHRTRELFQKRDTEAIQCLVPHLARAVQITARLATARGEGMLDALESMACAGILIDFLGRPIRWNGEALKLQGNGITVLNGKLGATDKSAEAGLERLVGNVLAPRAPPVDQDPLAVVLRRPSGRPLIAYSIPVVRSAKDVLQHAKAVVIIVDPDAHREPDEVALQQAFGLTKAELRIAHGLARGDNVKEIAERHGISIETARIQLKSVMAKTDTHRQSELVAVLTRLAAPLRQQGTR